MSTLKQCLITGRTNVGKTLLLLNFAEYCGIRHVDLRLFRPDSATEEVLRMPVPVARSRLVGDRHHQTRYIQSIDLTLPKGKGQRRFRLMDSAGLTDTIHPDGEVRAGVAQTLRALRQAHIVIHVLDAAAIGMGQTDALSEIDLQISRYAPLRSAYIVIANKIDLAQAPPGLNVIRQSLGHHHIIPVSALERTGFREVKSFVWDHL